MIPIINVAAYSITGAVNENLNQAYRIAVVSVVAPFEYSYILWASLVGYLIFADVPGPRTMIGGTVIVASGCYIILRERQQHRRTAAAAGDTGD